MEDESTRPAPEETATVPDTVPEEATPEEGAPAEAETVPAEETPAEAPTPDYAAMAKEDLAEIKRIRPSLAAATHLSDLPFARRFAEMREMGLSVKEALAAADPDAVLFDGKAHLRPAVSRTASARTDGISDADLKEARAIFGDLSDREIRDLYRRVGGK